MSSTSTLRVIGIDPGSVVCGFGVVDKTGPIIELVEYGQIEAAKAGQTFPLRLKFIFERLQQVIERCAPDEAAFESIFLAKNAQSLMKLSHARGVAMVVSTLREIPVVEYSAKEVKKAVTGNGNASKEQVSFMVRTMLKIEEDPAYNDATDALAVALCHTVRRGTGGRSSRNWADFVKNNPERIVK